MALTDELNRPPSPEYTTLSTFQLGAALDLRLRRTVAALHEAGFKRVTRARVASVALERILDELEQELERRD